MTEADSRQRLCNRLLGMEIKSFSISDKGDTEEIETFTTFVQESPDALAQG
jgi:hypothetical protein